MAHPPTNIRALQGDQALELVWDNSQATRLPYHFLRGECPCASCHNEWTGERILDPNSIPADLKIEGMEPIGTYAVRIVWSDGHSSGLFTWDKLKELSEQQRPESSSGSA